MKIFSWNTTWIEIQQNFYIFWKREKEIKYIFFDKVGPRQNLHPWSIHIAQHSSWKDLLKDTFPFVSCTIMTSDWLISPLSFLWTSAGFLFYSLMFQINPINLIIQQLKTVISTISMHSVYKLDRLSDMDYFQKDILSDECDKDSGYEPDQVNFWPRNHILSSKRGNFRQKKQRSLDVHDVR